LCWRWRKAGGGELMEWVDGSGFGISFALDDPQAEGPVLGPLLQRGP